MARTKDITNPTATTDILIKPFLYEHCTKKVGKKTKIGKVVGYSSFFSHLANSIEIYIYIYYIFIQKLKINT